MTKTRWTVVSFTDVDEWEDESDDFSLEANAARHAEKLARDSKSGYFDVVEHTTHRRYLRSMEVHKIEPY